MVDYIVYSDESGHWNEDGFYIRSWVIISSTNEDTIKGKINTFKSENQITNELKFNRNHNYDNLINFDFNTYFTLTINEQFKSRTFSLMNYIQSGEDSLFQINGKCLKNAILRTIEHTAFLNIYEYHHMFNFLEYLQKEFSNKSFKFYIDNPQCRDKDWIKLFNGLKEEMNLNLELKIIKKSQNNDGIQFADVIVGNCKYLMNNLEMTSFKNIDKKIISDFSLNNGIDNLHKNNPKIVMWENNLRGFKNTINSLKMRCENE